MPVFRLAAGFVLTGLGLAYLFHPTLIIRMNSFMRENVFRDSYALLSNRRIGSVLLLIGFLLLALTIGKLP